MDLRSDDAKGCFGMLLIFFPFIIPYIIAMYEYIEDCNWYFIATLLISYVFLAASISGQKNGLIKYYISVYFLIVSVVFALLLPIAMFIIEDIWLSIIPITAYIQTLIVFIIEFICRNK